MEEFEYRFKRFLINNKIEILIACLTFLFFSLTPIRDFGGDTVPVKYVTLSIINEGNFDLDEYISFLKVNYPYDPDKNGLPYYVVRGTNDHYLSTYGVGAPMIYYPFVAFANYFLKFSTDSWYKLMLTFKIASAILMSLASIVIYKILRYKTSDRGAVILTGAFALCTNVWTISSQAPWQHGPNQLMLLFATYFVIRGENESEYIKYAAIPLAFSVLIRPTSALFAIIFSLYIVWKHRDQFVYYMLMALPFFAVYAAYNYAYFQNIFASGQLIASQNIALIQTSDQYLWSGDMIQGMIGILFSPSRGIFIYSPFFVLLFLNAMPWKREPIGILLLVCSISLLITASLWFNLWGGYTYGYRTISDIIPFIIILLSLSFNEMYGTKWKRSIFWFLLVLAFSIQMIGAYLYDNSWNIENNVDKNHDVLWDWSNTQIGYYINKMLSRAPVYTNSQRYGD